ncbi:MULTISPECIES: type II CAAX endopeptidase family protein [unclassified Brevibacterium]|uniref:CPBP family intramembrane glutamic endopeptidase n=1 Tax=unclassified Brevibacterium TaxID=2614124 RepID=UPI0010F47234|nr:MULTISPECIES: type II CAAX endopeptidase family protein [unclassified Brevibacterium]MCM1013010.1 CPBP family intramembrane metalloprotease [Brevibacterium sp. XM4083]
MSTVPTPSRPNSVDTPTSSPTPQGRRPGWIELGVGFAVFVALTLGLTFLLKPAISPEAFSIVLMGLSFIAGTGGFAAAVAVRLRSASAFGLRPTAGRWLLLGVLGGLIAFALKFPATWVYVAVTGDSGNAQSDWSQTAATGLVPLLLGLVLLGVLTPIGEELFFRGVVTTVLLRYGAIVGVVGSALLFTILHGVPQTMLSAFIVGLITGELRRRSGSVWPGIIAHIIFNLFSTGLAFLVAPALGG